MTTRVSSGDATPTEIDPLETRVQVRSSMRLTPTRPRLDCSASGDPGPRADLLPLSDDELMAQVSAGSVESFVELYDRYCDRAYPCRAIGLS